MNFAADPPIYCGKKFMVKCYSISVQQFKSSNNLGGYQIPGVLNQDFDC